MITYQGLSLEQKNSVYDWLKSQEKWHAGKDDKWNKSQCRYYRRKKQQVFTFSDIVARSINKNKNEIARSIQSNNVLFKKLLTRA